MSGYIGRFHRVRVYAPDQGYSLPLVLDRRAGRLVPYDPDAWIDAYGLRPAIRGGALPFNLTSHYFAPNWDVGGAGTNTTALDSAYTYNSAGDAIGVRFAVPYALGRSLVNVYYSVSSVTGTAANVNDILVELRDEAGPGQKPGSTLHTSGSANPNDEATMVAWHKVAVTPFALVSGAAYWIVIADPDGNGTDFITVRRMLSSQGSFVSLWALTTTVTDGFVATPTLGFGKAQVVLELDNGDVLGYGFQSSQVFATDTNRRGLRLDAVTARQRIFGMWSNAVGAALSGIEAYEDDGTLPGGTPLGSGTTLIYQNNTSPHGVFFAAPVTFQPATPYRVVYTYGSTSNAPSWHQVTPANGYEAVLRQARPGGAGWYVARANGTTNWANDNVDGLPQCALLIEDQGQVAGGGPWSQCAALLNRSRPVLVR